MSGLVGGAGSKSGVIGETEIDYEEGTWDVTNSTQTPSSEEGTYIKIGKVVHFWGKVTSNASSTSGTGWGTLPFAIPSTQDTRSLGGTVYNEMVTRQYGLLGNESSALFFFMDGSTGPIQITVSKNITFSGTYTID